ncbi:DUF6461 domain-containing protein [Streptomyces sp. NPDC005122]
MTFARGIDPVGLASRLGSRPGRPAPRGSAEDAVDLLAGDGVTGVARVGRTGDWSFAVEYGDAVGSTTTGLGAVSAEGVEAVNFLLTPWHPPSMFSHYRDRAHICSFGIGEEARRWGHSPDLLVPALTEVGVLPVRSDLREADAERVRRLSVLTIEEHFGLRLPRTDVLHGRLPLFIVRETPERARRPLRPLG